MHLIVIVVALLLERTLGQIARLRRFDVFVRYVIWIERWAPGRALLARPLGVLVIVPPLALAGLVQWQLGRHGGLGIQLVFWLVGLLVSLGPRDLWEDVYALAHARSQAAHDEARARAVALSRRATGQAAADIEADTLLGAVLVQGHERVLAVIMWFVVAGPTGALFYRLVRELPALAARRPEAWATAATAGLIHGIAAFVPARLTAGLYALAGQSRAALRAARRLGTGAFGVDDRACWRVLSTIGVAALEAPIMAVPDRSSQALNTRMRAALSLITRSVVLLLALVAGLTLLGVVR